MSVCLRTFPGMLPMQLGVSGEAEVFLLSCAVGAGLGVLYQLLRTARVIFPHFRAVVFIEDLLFGLISGFCYFLIFSGYSLSMRAFIAFAMTLGAFIVHITAGRVFVALIRRTDRRIKGVLAKTARKIRHRFV